MNWDLQLNAGDFEILAALRGTLRRLLLRRWPGGADSALGGGRAAPQAERRLRRLLPVTEVVL